VCSSDLLKNKSGIVEDLIKKLKTDDTFKEAKYTGLLKNAQDLLTSLKYLAIQLHNKKYYLSRSMR
jgi:hypothetical protein